MLRHGLALFEGERVLAAREREVFKAQLTEALDRRREEEKPVATPSQTAASTPELTSTLADIVARLDRIEAAQKATLVRPAVVTEQNTPATVGDRVRRWAGSLSQRGRLTAAGGVAVVPAGASVATGLISGHDLIPLAVMSFVAFGVVANALIADAAEQR